MTAILTRETPVASTVASSLFDGAGGALSLAAATAAYRLVRNRRSTKRTNRKTDSDELQALRSMVDAIVEFMAGKPSPFPGAPATPGFLETYHGLQTQVANLTEAVEKLRGQIAGGGTP